MTQPESPGARDGPARDIRDIRDILLEREIRDREAGEYDAINSNL
ncbi:hypothetical protein [Rubrobacter indicoceani]|nr:hypothetical protein [Rubrobacter indicoceani]